MLLRNLYSTRSHPVPGAQQAPLFSGEENFNGSSGISNQRERGDRNFAPTQNEFSLLVARLLYGVARF